MNEEYKARIVGYKQAIAVHQKAIVVMEHDIRRREQRCIDIEKDIRILESRDRDNNQE